MTMTLTCQGRHGCPAGLTAMPMPGVLAGWNGAAAAWSAGTALAHLPFDAMRSQYACAVNAGLARRSILDARDFERAVDALEHLTLGPLARHV